jgi:hypothetical protein
MTDDLERQLHSWAARAADVGPPPRIRPFLRPAPARANRPRLIVTGVVATVAAVGAATLLGTSRGGTNDVQTVTGGTPKVSTAPGGCRSDFPIPHNAASSYPVNRNGMTYGSQRGALPGRGPDLIAAIGTNGVCGYVKSSDLKTTDPKNPTQALKRGKYSFRTVPLYAQDGTTVVGTFYLSAPTGSTATPSPHGAPSSAITHAQPSSPPTVARQPGPNVSCAGPLTVTANQRQTLNLRSGTSPANDFTVGVGGSLTVNASGPCGASVTATPENPLVLQPTLGGLRFTASAIGTTRLVLNQPQCAETAYYHPAYVQSCRGGVEMLATVVVHVVHVAYG